MHGSIDLICFIPVGKDCCMVTWKIKERWITLISILKVHEHNHPHILLLQIVNTFCKLRGGRLKPGENEIEGLKRKLSSKLAANSPHMQPNWQTRIDPSGANNANVNDGDTVDELDELRVFESFRSQFRRVETSNKSELTLYLEEPEISRKTKIDVLQFWKENQARYPRLAFMARDLLSVPITTVASESSFSIGGRILSKYRSSLSPSNAEALLCTRDWLDLKDDEEEMEGLSEDLEDYNDN